jgi:predicted nucleic acid-binding Zn ribbon protein
MSLVTIITFDDAISAHVLKAKLESEEILCFIHDENIVTLNPLYNFAVGGVKLKVNEKDATRALEIIQELEDKPYTNEADETVLCPNCSSTNLYSDFKSMKSATGVLAAITSFLFIVFPIYYKSVFKCKECGTEFKVK